MTVVTNLGAALLLVLAALLAPNPAFAQGAGPVVAPAPIIAAFNEAPPMAFTNDKGVVDGALIRLSREIFQRAGLPWTGAAYPAARLIKGLRDGASNFSMLVRVPEVEECCLYSATPVLIQEPTLYFMAGKTPIASKEELSGRSVIVINGYTYAGMIRHLKEPANAITVETAESLDSAFRMLEAGRADYLLSYQANAKTALAARPIKGIDFRAIARVPVYMVLAKSYPDSAATLNRLEDVAKSLDVQAILAAE